MRGALGEPRRAVGDCGKQLGPGKARPTHDCEGAGEVIAAAGMVRVPSQRIVKHPFDPAVAAPSRPSANASASIRSTGGSRSAYASASPGSRSGHSRRYSVVSSYRASLSTSPPGRVRPQQARPPGLVARAEPVALQDREIAHGPQTRSRVHHLPQRARRVVYPAGGGRQLGVPTTKRHTAHLSESLPGHGARLVVPPHRNESRHAVQILRRRVSPRAGHRTAAERGNGYRVQSTWSGRGEP